MGRSLRISVLCVLALAGAASATAGASVTSVRSPHRAFRCPAPVPVVGDVRRREVDALFFAVMRNAEAAGRMPVQADVDAALVATRLAAQAQPDAYTRTNVLLYSLTPGARAGFRTGFYTGETWGFTIEQRTLDAAPVVTDSEATYRNTGGDLAAVDAAYDVARGWRVASSDHRYATARVLVADALRRGVNEGRVGVLESATASPRTGWIGINVDRSRRTVVVRGRTCSKLVDRIDEAGVERIALARGRAAATCPADVRVPSEARRDARRLFDATMAHALTATPPRTSPDRSDVAEALATTGLAATDVTGVARTALPSGGLVYERGPDRFGVEQRAAGGGSFRIDVIGLDLPVLVRDGNDRRGDAVAGFAWAIDRVAGAFHRRGGRFRSARSLARTAVRGVRIPLVALPTSTSAAPTGAAGIVVGPRGRTAVVRGGLCGRVAVAYART